MPLSQKISTGPTLETVSLLKTEGMLGPAGKHRVLYHETWGWGIVGTWGSSSRREGNAGSSVNAQGSLW